MPLVTVVDNWMVADHAIAMPARKAAPPIRIKPDSPVLHSLLTVPPHPSLTDFVSG